MVVEIIPAVLPGDFEELKERTSRAVGIADTIHLDVCDGIFTPNASWPYKNNDTERQLPHGDSLKYELHIMTDEPEKYVSSWMQAGAKRIVVHVEAIKDFEALRAAVQGSAELVLALKFETPLETVVPFVNHIDGLQLMAISRIGYQGSPFETQAVEKVREARARFRDVMISVDGAVTAVNVRALVEAGAGRLIVGSTLFSAPDIAKTFAELEKIANQD